MFFAGKYMTVLFVSENVAAITNYVDIYLKCVGVSFIPLVFVNVYRNGIQKEFVIIDRDAFFSTTVML